ncbi:MULTISPECIES: hypothetical protein [Streptacidiphilus]|uniref:DUF1127 domain-containing protein n=1 Tax=Streptacidiphilus cavernicola TaxID=3342716 RepID=A0ABV6V1J1_9ACTN|nr:hypothetical protein [Streptacidiphilus jeojiense]
MDFSNDLAAVSAIGGRALVTAMTTDLWAATRARFARWLSRDRPDSEAVHLERLDRDHDALIAASGLEREELAQALETRWAGRLQDAAELDAESARILIEMVRQWEQEHPAETPVSRVDQNAKAGGHARIIQIGRDQNITRREPK